jgi:hypothetical protein
VRACGLIYIYIYVCVCVWDEMVMEATERLGNHIYIFIFIYMSV